MTSKVFKKSFTLEDLNAQLSAEPKPAMDDTPSRSVEAISEHVSTDSDITQIHITDIQILSEDSVGFNITLNQPAQTDIHLELNTSDGIESIHEQDGSFTIDKGATEYLIEVQTTGETHIESLDTIYITLSDNHAGQDIQINQSMAILKIDSSDAPSEVPSEYNQSSTAELITDQAQESTNETSANTEHTPEDSLIVSDHPQAHEDNFDLDMSENQEGSPQHYTESDVASNTDVDSSEPTPQDNQAELLLNSSPATLADDETQQSSQQDISDNAGAPVISIQEVEVNDSGNANYELKVSHPSSEEIIISFSAQNGSTIVGGSGINGDAILKSVGTLTIEPGQTSANIELKGNGDHLSDQQAPMDLNLDFVSGGEGATLAKPSSNISLDSSDIPKVGIADIDAIEGNLAMFTISLDNPVESDTHIQFSTHHGCKISGGVGVAQEHFDQTSGELIIPAGELYGIIDVQTSLNQASSVGDELVIRLDSISSEQNVMIDAQQSSATLTDINQYNNIETAATKIVNDLPTNIEEASESLTQEPEPLQQAPIAQQNTINDHPSMINQPKVEEEHTAELNHEPEVIEASIASPIHIDQSLALGTLIDNPSEELLTSDSMAAISLINTSGIETMLFDESPLSFEDKQLLQDIEPGRNNTFEQFDVINQELGMTLNLSDVISNLPTLDQNIDVLSPLNDAQIEDFNHASMVNVESMPVINTAEFDDIMHQVDSISTNTNLFE